MSEPVADLASLSEELLARAADAKSGRATHVFRAAPDGVLSQVLLVLLAGRELSEHENPGEAFLQVLRGRVRLTAGDREWSLGKDGHVAIPQRRHALVAEEDSVVLLTVARAGSQ